MTHSELPLGSASSAEMWGALMPELVVSYDPESDELEVAYPGDVHEPVLPWAEIAVDVWCQYGDERAPVRLVAIDALAFPNLELDKFVSQAAMERAAISCISGRPLSGEVIEVTVEELEGIIQQCRSAIDQSDDTARGIAQIRPAASSTDSTGLHLEPVVIWAESLLREAASVLGIEPDEVGSTRAAAVLIGAGSRDATSAERRNSDVEGWITFVLDEVAAARAGVLPSVAARFSGGVIEVRFGIPDEPEGPRVTKVGVSTVGGEIVEAEVGRYAAIARIPVEEGVTPKLDNLDFWYPTEAS